MKMILDTNKKICILLNPKTGSSTLLNMLKHLDFKIKDHTHTDHRNMKPHYGELIPKDLDEYKFFCFYRNPIDRFISSWSHLLDNVIRDRDPTTSADVGILLSWVYNDKSCLNLDYTEGGRQKLSKELEDKLLNSSLKRIAEGLIEQEKLKISEWAPQNQFIIPRFAGHSKQKYFLNHKNTTMLSYHNFEENIKVILEIYGLKYQPILDLNNHKIRAKIFSKLSDEDEQAIKECFKEDYEFFDSVGITF